MRTFIKVRMIVYVTTEPELHYTPDQTPVVTFGTASNRKWKTEGGVEHEETCFIDCTVWSNRAIAVDKYVSKGDPVYIEGNLVFEQWEKEGQKRSKHRVTVTEIIFLKAKEHNDG